MYADRVAVMSYRAVAHSRVNPSPICPLPREHDEKTYLWTTSYTISHDGDTVDSGMQTNL